MWKRLTASLVTGVILILSTCSWAMAVDIHKLSPNVPSAMQVVPYGSKPPKGDNGTHFLSQGAYYYSVVEVGAQVYTDRWLTGASQIEVSINGFKRVDGSALQVYDNVTVTVFDEDGKEIDSVWFDCYENPRGGVVTLDTPGSTAEFYVRFTVKHTDCKFSFNGSITKV